MLHTITGYEQQLIEIRHRLHEHPELALEETETGNLVADKLKEWGYTLHRGLSKTGVIGTLRVGDGKKTLGIRADMDALAIQEETGRPWASKCPNKMHACGHDGHTTILLGAARYLAETKRFNGTVHLIFQPAEELVNGGEIMVREGLFNLFPCDAVFALHNMPHLPANHFYFQPGALMASMDQFLVTINGVGGHGAMPHTAVDPVLVASHVTAALQSIVSRNVNPQDAAVLTVGSVHGGEAANIIPASVTMRLSVRALNPAVRNLLLERIPRLVGLQAESFGATATVEHLNGTPVLVNDEAQTRFACEVARKTFGDERAHFGTPPLMGSEDFAFMLEANPNGCYLFLGTGAEGFAPAFHNPHYDFNDACLVAGSQYWAALVEEFLR